MNEDPDEARLDALFMALSHGVRRRILDLLKRESGCNVNRVCDVFEVEISRFMVMKHLSALERAGLVQCVRDGREKRLYLDPTPLQLVHERWTTEFSAFWAARLTRLKYAAEGADVRPLTPMRKKHHHADAVFRIFINADIHRVWRELTKTGEAQGAVFNAWLHATGFAPGEAMQMRTGSGKYVMVVGNIVEWNPPYCFAHTHRFTQHDDAPCEVRYELKAIGGGVEVTMKLTGLPDGSKTAKEMTSGAPSILSNLKDICEQGRPKLGTRLLYALFARMEFVLPARSRSEHWPLVKKEATRR